MAAQTAPRIGAIRQGDHATIELLSVPMKAATKVYFGALVVSDAGYAAPGSTATGLVALGVCQDKEVDNSAGAAADKFVTVRRGTFKFLNSGGDPVVQADLLKTVYIVDDQTVCKTATGKSAAGRFMGFASDGGVFVEVLGF